MRGTIQSRKSAAHKLACLSLYRALIRQSTRFANQTTSSALIHLVRHRFHCDKRTKSPAVISDALKQGRAAHAVIQAAADGLPTALAQLTGTLSQVAKHASELARLRTHQNSLRGPTCASKMAKVAHVKGDRSKYWAEKIPDPIPVLDRPVPREQLPDPNKPRRVPILTHSQGIPFLRYKAGAQSPTLSRILKDLYMHDSKRWEANTRLQGEIEHAHLEDAWDRAVRLDTGYRDPHEVWHDDGKTAIKSWTEDTQVALKELQQSLKETASRRTELTHTMWNIVQKETELAQQEKAERRAKRMVEREREQKDREATAGSV